MVSTDNSLYRVGKSHAHHERNVDVLKSASLEEILFTAARLLGRRAQQLHPALDAKLVERIRQGQKRRHAGRGNEVVSAGVANVGKGVVLAVEVDEAAAGAADSLKRRLQAIGVAGDLAALGLEKGAEDFVGAVFFVSEFGVVEDLGRRVRRANVCVVLAGF